MKQVDRDEKVLDAKGPETTEATRRVVGWLFPSIEFLKGYYMTFDSA